MHGSFIEDPNSRSKASAAHSHAYFDPLLERLHDQLGIAFRPLFRGTTLKSNLSESMKRRQASLYLSGQSQIETVRLRYNPLQAQLIPAHVTLCREDEVTDWITFEARLKKLSPFQVTLTFGVPVREDNFVFLPVQEGRNNFHDFRSAILSKEARTQTPHVTLIHPRNGTCTDQIFAEIVATVNAPFQYSFREVMLIEQENGGVWKSISKVG